jgi:hypothetical protein
MLATGALAGSASAAPIQVDDFSSKDATRVPAFPQSENTNSATLTAGTESGLAGTIGGTRTSALGLSTMDVQNFDTSTISVFNTSPFSFFDYNSTTGAQSTSQLGYGLVAPLNLNATGQQFLRIDLLGFDAPTGLNLQVQGQIVSSAGGGTFTLPTAIVNTPGATSVNISLASLSAATLADVDQVTVRFVVPKSGDFRVDNISFVPEPATMASVFVCAVAAGVIRRPRRLK